MTSDEILSFLYEDKTIENLFNNKAQKAAGGNLTTNFDLLYILFDCWNVFTGDLKDEVSVLSWLLDDNNRELDDAIESVNFKMLDKLLNSSPFMAVFFCKLKLVWMKFLTIIS